MLDLNIDLVDNSSCDIEHETKMTTTTTEEKATECDDSGSSSVVEVLSSDRSSIPLSLSLFDFGILSKGKGLRIEEDCGEDSTTPLLVTRQLFPVTRGSGVGDSSSESKSLLRPQWLNLSGSGSDQMIKFQQKQQQQQQQQVVVKKSRSGPRSRSSQYRGVTFYRRTGRWESHIWDCGKQVYLGGFDSALAAARVHDRAAIKFRGADADINFNLCDYEEDMYQMNNMSKQEFVHILRRQSTGFLRGSSKYRGVTLHKCGRWEARMRQFLGKKYIYLGLFDTEIEAARAYDKEAIRCHGREAVTNFKASSYAREMSLDVNNLGGRTAQNLDLNLWSSPPTDVPKAKTNIRDFQLLFAASEMPAGKRPRVSVPLKHHIHNL